MLQKMFVIFCINHFGSKRVAVACEYADLHWGGRVQGEFLTMAAEMELDASQALHVVKV